MIGAPRLRHVELLLRRRRGDHGRAQHLAHFDRCETHAAARAMHQQHLARLQLPAIDQAMIGGAVGREKGRAFRVVEIRRQRRQL